MPDTDPFLEASQAGLSDVVKPHQQYINRRQRMVDFVQQCIRLVGRNDFFQLDELLKTKMAETIEQDADLGACKAVFDRLRTYADEQVERYRIEFIDDLRTRAAEAELPMEIDFPRFSVLKGIEGQVDFSARRTMINKKQLKSIDPRRIVSEALKVKRRLYDRPFDPASFIEGVYKTYREVLEQDGKTAGHPVPMQRFYRAYVLSLQSKAFFQDMDKGKFRGYSADQMAVDFWRYAQAGIGGVPGGYALQLKPGRNSALWLIDTDGERRQITTISFQERV